MTKTLISLLLLIGSITSQAQPTNDICSSAISLSVDGSCAIYDNSGASRSSSPDFLCGWSGEGRDIWFSAVVLGSGNLTVEINEVSGSSIGHEVIMELHEGNCGSLTPLACSHNKDNYNTWDPFPKIEITGRTAGERIYVRVTGWNDQEGEFEICASDAYGAYPCRIDKMILGAQSTCDPSTNTFTQEVTVHYRHDGSTPHGISIMHNSFDLTGSPQTETVTLAATGGLLDMNAWLEGDWNDCIGNANYFNGGGIQALDNCYSGTVINDDPCGAISLNVTQGCVEYTGDNTGATSYQDAGVMDYFECRYAGGIPQDVWFKFNMPLSGRAVVNTYGIQEGLEAIFELYTGSCGSLMRYEGCLPIDGWKGPGTPWHSYHIDDLPSGTELYVRVADDGGNTQGQFGICIIEPEAFTNDICSNAINISVGSSCDERIFVMHPATASENPTTLMSCDNQDKPESEDVWFAVTIPVSGSVTIATEELERGGSNFSMGIYEGTCGNLNLVNCSNDGGENGHPSYNLSGRIPGEVVYVRLSEWQDDNGSSYRICATSLPNDACSGAIAIPTGSCTTFTETGATPSPPTIDPFRCGWTGEGRDVWFSTTVPASGNLSIEGNMIDGGPYGLIMEAYSGSCGALTPLACSSDKNRYTDGRDYPLIELEGRTHGEIIYIRITSGGDPEVPFEICTSDAGYRDPCKILYIAPSTQSACDPSTNTFTQDLLVYYRHDGSVDRLAINNQTFDLDGSNPQLVTLTLPATGNYENIDANLDGDWNLCTANSYYRMGDVIKAPQNCYSNIVVNDEPCDAVFLAVTDGCIEYIGNNTGATHSMEEGINYNFECNWAGSTPLDVWYMFEVPPSGNVVVNTYNADDINIMDALFEVYTGTCNNLSYIGGCSGAPWASLRYDNLTPGDMLYVRVAESGGDVQGNFGICIIEPEPMVNDVCNDAIDIAVTGTCTGDIYSMHTATASNMPSSVHDCEDSNNNSSRDIWFKVTVPESGIVNIYTESVERNDDDLLMSIYEGGCGSLNLIQGECHHRNLELGQVSTGLYGRTPGEVLYVRISQWGSWGESGAYSAFRMCATSADGITDGYYQGDCHMDRHNTSLDAAWVSCEGSPNPNTDRNSQYWTLLNLDSISRLEELHIWNLNHPDYIKSGAKTIAIDFMDSNNAWQQLGEYTLSKANGSGFYEGEIIDLQATAQSDKFLITVIDNYGGPCSGLSEVRIGVSNPEPVVQEDCLNAIDLVYPIENVNTFDHITYRTNETISGDITVEPNATLILDAKQGVMMNPGFEVSNQAILEVYLEGCGQQSAFSGSSTSSDSIIYLGAGNMDGLTINSSSDFNQSIGENIANGSGMDADFMLASRFLAQAALGFNEGHVEDVLNNGYEAWIDQQMQVAPSYYKAKTLEAYEYHRQVFFANNPNPTATDSFAFSEANTWRDMYSVWWTIHEDNEDLLRQRVALALSEIFVISTNVDDLADDATGVADFYDMLVDYSFGNFRELLEDVTLHVCMGTYLSHMNNPKTDLANNIFPDENYAREIMQLFTIGLYELNANGTPKLDGSGNLIATYDNGHIKELAKVFTGLGGSKFGKRYLDDANGDPGLPQFGIHNIYDIAGDEPMIMFDNHHEPGLKTIVGDNVIPAGQSGMQDIEMALDILFNHDNVGPFIGKQLIQRLVKSNPTPEYIERVANVFNDNGSGVRGDLGAVVEAILLDDEARGCEWIDNSMNGKLREPIIRFLHYVRALGRDPNINPDVRYYTNDLEYPSKQQPLRAPSVFNFYLPTFQPVGAISEAGLVAPEFQIYDAQTSIDGPNFLDNIIYGDVFSETFIHNLDKDYEDRRVDLDYTTLLQFPDDDEALINYIDRLFTHGRLSDRTRLIIREAIRPMRDWDPMYHSRESMALYLILNSPDYNILK